jgi:hypothetical protein
MIKFLVAVLVAALALTAARGQDAVDPDLEREIRLLDIAGIYWGQPQKGVYAELQTRGFQVDEDLGHPDFRREVANEAAKRMGRPWNQSDGQKSSQLIRASKGPEALEITLQISPDGLRVVAVTYSIGTIEQGALHTAALAKYGARGIRWNGGPIDFYTGSRYCLQRDTACQRQQSPNCPWISEDSNHLALYGGRLGEATFVDAFEAAVKEQTSIIRPSF